MVSTSRGSVAGTGHRVGLGPGERTTIRFFAESDSLDLRDGPMLPPGRYQLVVTIPIYSLAGAQMHDQQLISPPIPVDIIAAPDVQVESTRADLVRGWATCPK